MREKLARIVGGWRKANFFLEVMNDIHVYKTGFIDWIETN